MQAVVFPGRGHGFLSSSALRSTCRNSIFSNKDWTLFSAYQRGSIQSSVLSIRSDGNRRGRSPRRNTPSDRAAKKNEEQKISRLSDGNSSESSKQEEIIALFRRIQSSIAKGESASSKKRSSSSKVKKSVESVLDVLSQYPSREQLQDKDSNKEGDKIFPQRTAEPRKEPKAQEDSIREDFKVSRPPSNFVKRSPIPSTEALKQRVIETSRDVFPAGTAVKDSELQRVDTLKLTELKELAKSKGVKGYSKLKKGELAELLKGMMQS